MIKDTITSLSRTTVRLHWLVAIMMIGLLAVGIYMEEQEVYALYPWHKSLGVLILLLVLPRIVWRIMNGWPKSHEEHSSIETFLAKLVHWLLILGTLLMPISGMMMSGFGGHGIFVFGIELFAINPDPANPKEVIAVNGTLASFGHEVHGVGSNVLIVAIVLHVIGAIKHHLIDKDNTLNRMLGK